MNKTDLEITIERLDQTNINSLPVLYHVVYGRKMTAAFFEKKYKTGYAGLVYTGYIAYTKGHRPVAFLGAIPCELNYDKKIISAAQLTDGMTDPAYQGRGLFVQLIEKITELCKQNNVRFLFGFPNQHSLPVFLNKQEWKEYGKMDLFCLPLQALPLEKISRKLPVFTYLYNRYLHRVLKRYIYPSTTNMPSVDPGTYKNDDDTKYTYPDSIVISIRDVLVRIKIKHGMRIGEMDVSENEFDDVMGVLKKLAGKLGVDTITFHCSTDCELHRLFAGRYKSISSFTIVSKDLGSGIPLGALKFMYGDIDIF